MPGKAFFSFFSPLVMELKKLLNNRSEKESSLCLSFLMQSCSAVLTSSDSEINRKLVEKGDQDHSLSEN